jgi:hypothetical protein
MARAIGIKDFQDKQFDCFAFDGPWKASFGEPEKNFRMLVYGHPGNGKTEFCIQFAKYLSQFKKVYYNSFEQGISKSLQDAVNRNKLQEVSGKIIFGDKETLDEMVQRLSNRNSPHFVLIDSRDYMNLSHQQYKMLVEKFPHKSFVIICWESNSKPRGEHAKQMEYMVDIKIHVKAFKAYPRCRYGGNEVYTIWDKPSNREPKPLGGLFGDIPNDSPQPSNEQ